MYSSQAISTRILNAPQIQSKIYADDLFRWLRQGVFCYRWIAGSIRGSLTSVLSHLLLLEWPENEADGGGLGSSLMCLSSHCACQTSQGKKIFRAIFRRWCKTNPNITPDPSPRCSLTAETRLSFSLFCSACLLFLFPSVLFCPLLSFCFSQSRSFYIITPNIAQPDA